jgi:RNase P subunit RPR2
MGKSASAAHAGQQKDDHAGPEALLRKAAEAAVGEEREVSQRKHDEQKQYQSVTRVSIPRNEKRFVSM